MTTEHGWESVIVRYTSFLLLTYIANALMIKTPNRVNQDVLHKAISSGNFEKDLYNSLLLKHASDWLCVKTNSRNEQMDLAASNAYEVTQMLWKLHNRYQSLKPSKQLSNSKCKGHRREKNGNRYALSPQSLKGERRGKVKRKNTAYIQSSPRVISPNGLDCSRDSIGEYTTYNQQQDCASKSVSPPAKGTPNFSRNSCKMKEPVNEGERNTIPNEKSEQDDEESLEEGEIRESTHGSPYVGQRSIQHDLNCVNNFVSDISSSEGEMDSPGLSLVGSERILPGLASYHQYNYQYHSSLSNDYQHYHHDNYQMPLMTHEGPPSEIQLPNITSDEPMVTIELSDDEPVLEYTATDEAVINLNSDEESTFSSLSSRGERNEPRPPLEQKTQKGRQSKSGGKEKLRLKTADGSTISWPTAIARSGPEILWKWWRDRIIEGNHGSLFLTHPGFGEIHGVIPILSERKGSCIAVPKIVDDVHQFLQCLGDIKFPEDFTKLHLNYEKRDTRSCSQNSNQNMVNTTKLLPLAEELSRGSVKRVSFEISKKKTPSVSIRNRLTIKEFASIRNLTVNTRTRSDSVSTRNVEGCSSSSFYSYGEQMSLRLGVSSNKPCESPLGTLITTSKTHMEDSNANTSRTHREKQVSSSSEYRKERKRSSKSVGFGREEKIISSVTHKRRRDSSSSSSDRSQLREKYRPERYRRNSDSTIDQSRSRNRHRYADPVLSELPSDSSPSRELGLYT